MHPHPTKNALKEKALRIHNLYFPEESFGSGNRFEPVAGEAESFRQDGRLSRFFFFILPEHVLSII